MPQESAVPGASEPSQSLAEAVEPMKAALLDLSMSTSDSRRALENFVKELRRQSDNPILKSMETELERMDSLIFDSMEKTDDLFTLIASDLESRAAAADASGRRATGSALVDELDAYLDGAFDRLERPPRQNTGTQTEAPAIASASPASAWRLRKDTPSMDIFDLMSKKIRAQGARPKLQIKTEFDTVATAAASASWAKKTSSKKPKRRVASPSVSVASPSVSVASPLASDSETEDEEAAAKTEVKRRRYSTSAIKGRHPREVRGFRMENGVKEYAIQYKGVDHLTWVTMDTATKAVQRMITAYNHARRKQVQDAVTQALHGPSDAAAEGQATDQSEVSEGEPMYIVDKIVDHRTRNGKREYYVKWEGYDTDENTWEPASKLRREVSAIVDEYERKLAKKNLRKKAEARELMRTRTAMQAKVDELTSKHSQSHAAGGPASSSFPGKRLDVTPRKGSRSIASTEEDDEDDVNDSQSDSLDESSSDQESLSSDGERAVDDHWARMSATLM